MKTFNLSHKDIKKDWVLIDAKNLVVGRLASRIALMLIGKHKATYTPFLDCGDNIIVINADKLVLTGRKATNEKFYWHTGYIGGIKEITLKKLMETKPHQLLRNAVKRMLGNKPIGRKRLGNLYIYSGEDHPHSGQKPVKFDFASLNRKNHI